jgi:hypothetical protein
MVSYQLGDSLFAVLAVAGAVLILGLDTALDGLHRGESSSLIVAQFMVVFETVRPETLSRSPSQDFIRQCKRACERSGHEGLRGRLRGRR